MSEESHPNFLPIRREFAGDDPAIEMVRVWIGRDGIHSTVRHGVEHSLSEVPATVVWGTILADIAQLAAQAIGEDLQRDMDQILETIKQHFLIELRVPPAS